MRLQIFILSFLACTASVYSENYTPLEEAIKCSAKFAPKFLSLVVDEDKNKNVACSSLSGLIALSLASFGVKGKNEELLKKALALPQSKKSTVDGFNSLISSHNSAKNVTLNIVSKLYVAKNLGIKDDFKSLARYFHTDSDLFESESELVADANEWIANKTNNNILRALNQDNFMKGDTDMLLINTIYFNGGWEKPFDKRLTKNFDFYGFDKTVPVPQMIVIDHECYGGDLINLQVQFIELPYKNGDYKMTIITGKEKKNMTVDRLEYIGMNLEYIMGQIPKHRVLNKYSFIRIPKFTIENEINLSQILEKMGIPEILNFENIYKNPALEKDRNIQAIQKVKIVVDETGTEAAVTTAFEVRTRSLGRTFYANKPFYYIISSSMGPIFQGRVVTIPEKPIVQERVASSNGPIPSGRIVFPDD